MEYRKTPFARLRAYRDSAICPLSRKSSLNATRFGDGTARLMTHRAIAASFLALLSIDGPWPPCHRIARTLPIRLAPHETERGLQSASTLSGHKTPKRREGRAPRLATNRIGRLEKYADAHAAHLDHRPLHHANFSASKDLADDRT